MLFCFVGDINDMLVQTETEHGKVAWKCLICGKEFTEEGKVVWRCEYCAKEFPFKSGVNRHIETLHC